MRVSVLGKIRAKLPNSHLAYKYALTFKIDFNTQTSVFSNCLVNSCLNENSSRSSLDTDGCRAGGGSVVCSVNEKIILHCPPFLSFPNSFTDRLGVKQKVQSKNA